VQTLKPQEGIQVQNGRTLTTTANAVDRTTGNTVRTMVPFPVAAAVEPVLVLPAPSDDVAFATLIAFPPIDVFNLEPQSYPRNRIPYS
jgi:hypothetical protein